MPQTFTLKFEIPAAVTTIGPIPLIVVGGAVTINWGDGTPVSNTITDTHTYTSADTYTVTVTTGGGFTEFGTPGVWGQQYLTEVGDLPSTITKLQYAFYLAANFDHPIGSWDVSNVMNMRFMFQGATKFNRPLDGWDVGNVITMHSMFDGATKFNQPLNSWDVSKVTDMRAIFSFASAFNQSIDDWDVSRVVEMGNMFSYTTKFNQPLNSWNVSTVQYMGSMFYEALAFNQPLNNWDVSNVLDMSNMFANTSMSVANYNALLNSWSVQNVQHDIPFGANGMKYSSAGLAARNILTDSKSWNIVGDEFVSDPICFVKGTKILTQKGYIAIEDLQPNDKIVTTGTITNGYRIPHAKRIHVIKKKLHFTVMASSKKFQPICIKAHTFGQNMPFADLFISPGHGIQVNNKIVRARDLINGKTITQSKKTEEVTYYHIELATHAMIDANGVAAESYLELTKNKPTPTSVTSA